jgi:hypothetical protein
MQKPRANSPNNPVQSTNFGKAQERVHPQIPINLSIFKDSRQFKRAQTSSLSTNASNLLHAGNPKFKKLLLSFSDPIINQNAKQQCFPSSRQLYIRHLSLRPEVKVEEPLAFSQDLNWHSFQENSPTYNVKRELDHENVSDFNLVAKNLENSNHYNRMKSRGGQQSNFRSPERLRIDRQPKDLSVSSNSKEENAIDTKFELTERCNKAFQQIQNIFELIEPNRSNHKQKKKPGCLLKIFFKRSRYRKYSSEREFLFLNFLNYVDFSYSGQYKELILVSHRQLYQCTKDLLDYNLVNYRSSKRKNTLETTPATRVVFNDDSIFDLKGNLQDLGACSLFVLFETISFAGDKLADHSTSVITNIHFELFPVIQKHFITDTHKKIKKGISMIHNLSIFYCAAFLVTLEKVGKHQGFADVEDVVKLTIADFQRLSSLVVRLMNKVEKLSSLIEIFKCLTLK